MIRKFMFLLLVLVGCGNGSRSSTGTPGALSCASSVETFCIDGHETQCSWSTELGAETCQVVTSCHGYLVAIEHGVDTGTYYYYDTTAGKLIAAIAYGVPGRLACAAGPSTGFVVPVLSMPFELWSKDSAFRLSQRNWPRTCFPMNIHCSWAIRESRVTGQRISRCKQRIC